MDSTTGMRTRTSIAGSHLLSERATAPTKGRGRRRRRLSTHRMPTHHLRPRARPKGSISWRRAMVVRVLRAGRRGSDFLARASLEHRPLAAAVRADRRDAPRRADRRCRRKLTIRRICSLLSPRTRIVAIGHVSNASRYGPRAAAMIAARRSRTSGSISRRARSSRPAATRAIAVASVSPRSGALAAEPVANGALGEPPERDELAARADRLRDRAELVGDEHDRRVERRLLQILQQRIGSVVVEQMGREQEVDPAIRLERPQVQVVVQLADDVDPDHVAERLDDPQIRVRAVDDAPGVAEPGARERERGLGLPDPCRPVEEERVGVTARRVPRSAAASPRSAQGRPRSGRHRSPRRARSASSPVPSTTDRARDTVGLALGELPIGARRHARGSRRPRARSGRARRPSAPTASSAPISSRIVQVGHQPLDGRQVELEHALEPETARDALVGDRRVDVAVADHRRPARERGPDQLLDVLGTRRRVERGLRPRSDVATVEHEVADLLAERRATGLAGEDDLDGPRPRAAHRAAAPGWSCRSRRAPRR